MKAYTSLVQSRKLAEILPIESADVCWQRIYDEVHLMTYYRIELLPYRLYSGIAVPCWSLSALLEAINDDYYTTLYHDGVAWNIEVIHHDNVEDKHSVYANTPIDACCELVLNFTKKSDNNIKWR